MLASLRGAGANRTVIFYFYLHTTNCVQKEAGKLSAAVVSLLYPAYKSQQ